MFDEKLIRTGVELISNGEATDSVVLQTAAHILRYVCEQVEGTKDVEYYSN